MTDSVPYVHCGPHLGLWHLEIDMHCATCLQMLTVSKSEADIFKKFKTLHDLLGSGWCATDLQCHAQISDDDPRTGTFCKMQI